MSQKRRVQFQDSWLSLTDSNGTLVSKWAKKDLSDPYYSICIICKNTRFKIDGGVDRIKQHAKTEKHIKNLSSLNSGQLLLTTSLKNNALTQSSSEIISNLSAAVSSDLLTPETNANIVKSVTLFNQNETAVRAELLWCLENVITCSSVASCLGKKELFNVMFPGCVPETFSLSPSKAQYLITEALGPYFKNLLLNDLEFPDVLFSLLFDETSNVKSKKELQIRVRFWSHDENMIVCRHLETFFIGSATGEILVEQLKKALDSNNLLLKNVLALGCDGPNVNKKVMNLFQETLKKAKLKPLVNIGTCELHIVHTSFLKGCECLDVDISDFIIKVYYFFHHRDVRCETFESIQREMNLPVHVFIKHVKERWLTLGASAERMEEQFLALEYYFLKHIPQKDSTTLKKQNYQDVKLYLKNDLLKVSLQFAIYSSKIFTTEFTLIMQKEEPLIHLLYAQLKSLILILLSSFVKQSILESIRFYTNDILKLLEDPKNFLDLEEINIGEKARKTLLKLPKLAQLSFLNQARKFYIASVKHILSRVKCFRTLKYFQCLGEENIKKNESVKYIIEIAKLLPLQNVDIDRLECEWRLLRVDEQVRFTKNKDERIDVYWNHIFSLKSQVNNYKYPEIKRVVQNALALTHGNADVERGFSLSSRVLTEDKSNMSERTLNAKLYIIDALKKYDKMVYKVPITSNLIKLAQGAYKSYQLYLEKQKLLSQQEAEKKRLEEEASTKEKEHLKTLEKNRRTIKKLEIDLKSAEKDYKAALEDSESMQNALTASVKNNAKEIVIKEMVVSLEKLREVEKKKRNEVDKLNKSIRRKNSILMDSATK
ncbi:uncharacterized protein LOC122500314 [Leptopilina heterotoma]|uniref:uncharacterized protein LOC122500314 n=1 Tax=Leptopilina heterotoma TaxID=63436 RepID=UPI001CA83E92|nr:uncharacterized protein LOC122500314 [Leptopilina heterotoma]